MANKGNFGQGGSGRGNSGKGNSGGGSSGGRPPLNQPPYDEDGGEEDREDSDETDSISDALSEELGDAVALFPDVPEEMGIDPVLLGLLHCVVFLCGSNDEIVHPDGADLVMQQVMACCSRLSGARLAKIKEDMHVLTAWSKEQGHGKGAVEFLETFLDEMGAGTGQ